MLTTGIPQDDIDAEAIRFKRTNVLKRILLFFLTVSAKSQFYNTTICMEDSKILIIDDDGLAIQIMKRILHQAQSIISASNGVQGLELAMTHRPDLILLDMVMPEMTGVTVMQKLSASDRTRDIPVIIVTTNDDIASELEALQAGAVDFIHKPINPAVLLARVKTHIRLRERELKLIKLYEELDIKKRQLEYLSTHDQLTGLYNRVMLKEFLAVEFANLTRNNKALCLAMLDLDHFKRINDDLGHQMGDKVLADLGERLKRRLRKSDAIFRYGGEEFLIVLADTNLNQANQLLEQLRQELQNSTVGGLKPGTVTVSLGITQIHKSDKQPEAAIKRADLALYQSKSNGRNLVTIIEHQTAQTLTPS